MTTNCLNLKECDRWLVLLKMMASNGLDVYFTPEYYSLYQNYGDGEARCFVFEQDGEIVLYPFLINPITPLGYKLDKEFYDIQGAYGYNGIITSSEDADFIAVFWKTFDAYCQENDIVAEFTRFHPRQAIWSTAHRKTSALLVRICGTRTTPELCSGATSSFSLVFMEQV